MNDHDIRRALKELDGVIIASDPPEHVLAGARRRRRARLVATAALACLLVGGVAVAANVWDREGSRLAPAQQDDQLPFCDSLPAQPYAQTMLGRWVLDAVARLGVPGDASITAQEVLAPGMQPPGTIRRSIYVPVPAAQPHGSATTTISLLPAAEIRWPLPDEPREEVTRLGTHVLFEQREHETAAYLATNGDWQLILVAHAPVDGARAAWPPGTIGWIEQAVGLLDSEPPRCSNEPPVDRWVPAAEVGDLEDEQVIYLPDHQVFLVYTPEGPLALSAVTPHGGDELLRFCRRSQLFEAPAHGEKFDRFGHYFGGPAPRSMDRVAVRVRDGWIEVRPADVREGPKRRDPPALDPQGDFCASVIEEEPGFLEPGP